MSSREKVEAEEPELSQEQSVLFTRLQRHAVPVVQARNDATKELGLVDVVEGLYNEMTLKQPGGPQPASEQEWEGLLRKWAGLMRGLDAWILEECKRGRLLVYGLPLPLSPSSIAMPVPSGLFETHELGVDKGTLLGEHWSFTDLRIVFATVLNPRQRELIEDGLWTFGCWLANETMETVRQNGEPASAAVAHAQPKQATGGRAPKQATGGRPPKQREMVQALLKELEAAGELPKTAGAARAKALIHFGSKIEGGKVHVRSIYRAVDLFYRGQTTSAAGQK